MAVNTFKTPTKRKKEKAAPRRSIWTIFSFLENYVRIDGVFEQGLPVRYIPAILFITGLGVFYIGNIHYAEKNIRKFDQLRGEVNDMRFEYITLKANYMFLSKQSEVARKVEAFGLYESTVPPYKIIVKENEE